MGCELAAYPFRKSFYYLLVLRGNFKETVGLFILI
jgi:hypothetical protein